MHNKRWLSICFLLVALIPFFGCKSQPINPNQGFTVTTSVETLNSAGGPGPLAPMPGQLVLGQVVPGTGTAGTVGSYDDHTSLVTLADGSQSAQYYVSNGIAPASWNHYVWVPSDCAIPLPPIQLVNSMGFSNEFGDLGVQTANLSSVDWQCGQNLTSMPGADSRFAFAGSVPASVTLSGQQPFSTQYGMPILYAFTGTGAAPKLAATITASSVSSGGATATFPLGNSLPQGGYFFVTENKNSTGGYDFNSWNLYTIAGSQTIAGNPFGVSVGAQTINYLETNSCVRPAVKTTSSTSITFPAVSLYSSNEVSISGSIIGVGSNPTAIAAYQSLPVTINFGSGCDTGKYTYTGTTRAIVTNSGGNTVTVLDIVNNKVFTTITVGTQPVAIVTAADGSAAYVANYKDNTVSRIDLTTDTVTSTVAVGGSPTSVSLTSAGILWVGGAGFLTQINTSTMAVAGTESVAGKTIIALGYSDSLNELIATSVDTSNNVIADEINPATFQSGGTYTTMASHTISTLGTYTQPSGQIVRAFTSTLANNTSISSILTGAPPLVVQDGWAVVTATPTGFTITDASGHVVLVSETTPSPVTAIAVDAKLNVAYLTMPDSNTMLTVPLPGTN